MKIGENALHTFLITTTILILDVWCTNLRNLEKCDQILGVLQCKKLTSDLKESETCHISQMKAFLMLKARFEWLLAALGGIRVMIFQSLRICLENVLFCSLIFEESVDGVFDSKNVVLTM